MQWGELRRRNDTKVDRSNFGEFPLKISLDTERDTTVLVRQNIVVSFVTHFDVLKRHPSGCILIDFSKTTSYKQFAEEKRQVDGSRSSHPP